MFYKQFLGMPDKNKANLGFASVFYRCIVALNVYRIILLLSGIGIRS